MAMIGIEEARRLVLDNLPPRRVERVHFRAALNRVLAEDVAASMDLPPFNRAAMDGYALRSADVLDVPAVLDFSGGVRAGGEGAPLLKPGQAMAVATGAPVPAGADAVQMLEQVQPSADGCRVTILQRVEAGQNIVRRGFEAACGETVLEAGRTLGPPEIAVLATFGQCEVRVWRRPEVALLATGDELVEVDDHPHGPQIRNSNAYSLAAQLQCLGIEPRYLGIAHDDPVDLRARVAAGLQRDVLIISGGASVGPYDLVKNILEAAEIDTLFTKVAMRPGKPTIFGRKGNTLVFGLPGNPVSSMVSFENFVRPALGRMCGFARPDLERVGGELLRPMKQAPGRTAFLPAVASWHGTWKIDPLPWKGSADILGFSRANALVIFPGDREVLDGGEQVEALLLPDYFNRRR